MNEEKCKCSGRVYMLLETDYVLCIECGKQYSMDRGD
jgi:predicted transcriptional regulator